MLTKKKRIYNLHRWLWHTCICHLDCDEGIYILYLFLINLRFCTTYSHSEYF